MLRVGMELFFWRAPEGGEGGEGGAAGESAAAFPDARFKRPGFQPLGPTAFVALSLGDLDAFDAAFRGVRVRALARVREKPLRAREAVYLPVSYDSWLVLAEGAEGFGAAWEAAGLLGARSVVCREFASGAAPRAAAGMAGPFGRHMDRVFDLKNEKTGRRNGS